MRRLCESLGVACHVERVTVRRAPPWDGLEAESRRARHAALERVARAVGAARIATGHTADDQAETVLMRLLQGAGPRGLGGIAPARGLLIRPLIETRRAAIEAHLRGRGLAWVEDPSNRDPRFLRNRIRHDLLPFMAELTGASVVEALGRSAAAARAVVADLEERARADLARLATRDGAGLSLDVGALAERPIELAAEMLRQAAAVARRDAPAAGTGPARAPPAARGGPAPSREPGWAAWPWSAAAGGCASGRWRCPRSWRAPGPCRARSSCPRSTRGSTARIVARARDYAIPREPGRAAFDADTLPSALAVRARRRGDVFSPFGAPALRRLKSFLIDAGVPRWQRARTPLVEAGGEIIWVAGIRRGSHRAGDRGHHAGSRAGARSRRAPE